ncbi:MAG: bifunctional 23S rRNA (guanine(2069)-N(7))-methyltransferase RlmK/23S rRNA (guanine(2445)-N(2))-methyltransferase RlmL, partial [Succinivibrionaceae bacterium]|nr:bifunctional 23S rRNA (guanine(2069)-N(7))-methyltransferase RlmK/23S rRNA (guanine(2445)-N(2))-methyltransferase RlmL [Succinivibrionaceae bacterium]
MQFFATCPNTFEQLLHLELEGLGAGNVRESSCGVHFEGDFQKGMEACLWSRFASRVLLLLGSCRAPTDRELYAGALDIPYEDYFEVSRSIAVGFTGTNQALRNEMYSALRIKDAICDRFVKACGERPSVSRDRPDVLVQASLRHDELSVYIDLSGAHALHRREQHRRTGVAPLKENLAAAMLARLGYKSGNLIDPMCGSGTLLTEAAAVATDTAPGLDRQHFGFECLKIFDEAQWQSLRSAAQVRSRRGHAQAVESGMRIVGRDSDQNMVDLARSNAERAGYQDLISVEQGSLSDLRSPFGDSELPCYVVTNPPYGRRLGNFNELLAVYTELGDRLRLEFSGAQVGVVSSSHDLLSCLRLRPDHTYSLYNGDLDCQLRIFRIERRSEEDQEQASALALDPAFPDKVREKVAAMAEWAAPERVEAYRVYNADLPGCPVAIDRYKDYFVVNGYRNTEGLAPQLVHRRLLDVVSATVAATGVPGNHVILKERMVQHGAEQYGREGGAVSEPIRMAVREGDLSFYVNLTDYLDTGLFLDARPIRKLIMGMASGASFLNLFCYTGSATVAAAVGGAEETLSVDMSRTYLKVALDNLALNGIPNDRHEFLQKDCLAFLSEEGSRRFSLIYLDPPTFSNSKRMSETLDVKRDQVRLISNLTRHLTPQGKVIFCTNSQGFTLDTEALEEYGFTATDITPSTIPEDFALTPEVHRCYVLSYDKERQQKDPEPFNIADSSPRWNKEVTRSGARPVSEERQGPWGNAAGHGHTERAWGAAAAPRGDYGERGDRGYGEGRGFGSERYGSDRDREEFGSGRDRPWDRERRPSWDEGESRERPRPMGEGLPQEGRGGRDRGFDRGGRRFESGRGAGRDRFEGRGRDRGFGSDRFSDRDRPRGGFGSDRFEDRGRPRGGFGEDRFEDRGRPRGGFGEDRFEDRGRPRGGFGEVGFGVRVRPGGGGGDDGGEDG